MKKKLFAFTPLDNCAASTSAFSGNVIKNQLLLKTLTRGPARATISSSAGSSGSLSNRAKPPMEAM
jgi:hypothetical protein